MVVRKSYFRQAFYFQLREIVSNLAPLTAVWVPEDVTFCSPYGNRTRLLSVKGICPKPIDEGTIFSFPICQRTLLFCCYLQQRYKITTFFLICQVSNKKKPIFLRWVFKVVFDNIIPSPLWKYHPLLLVSRI